MSDISKERKGWRGDFAKAEQRLNGLGGKLEWSDVPYEVARWSHVDLVLIFYAHRTSAGNYHVRVRKGKCTDRKLLEKCIYALAENSCTFQFPSEPELHRKAVHAAIDKRIQGRI